MEDFEKFDLKPPQLKESNVSGQIINIDDFGNLVTNISSDLVRNLAGPPGSVRYKDRGTRISGSPRKDFWRSFGGGKLCYIGSIDTLEIAKKQGKFGK